jgi:hypothetical protein
MDHVHPVDSTKDGAPRRYGHNASPSGTSDHHPQLPPSLSSLSIRSTNTLTGRSIPIRIPETWNEQPPLLQLASGVKNKGRGAASAAAAEETTVLLKGVSVS